MTLQERQRATRAVEPLTARVIWFENEPAYALANRLARRNGVNSLASFGGDMGIPFRDIIRGCRNGDIAALANINPAALNHTTFRIDEDDWVRLGNEVLHRDDWSYTSLRICPSCLKEDLDSGRGDPAFRAHVRAWWNVTHMRACPLHKVMLLDRIPRKGGASIDPKALDVRFAAGSAFDFATAHSPYVNDVRAETYMLGRLGFMPRVSAPILDELPLWNAIRLMDRFGAVAVAGHRGFTSFGGGVSHREALSAGFDIFSSDKAHLFRFLDNLVSSAKIRLGHWGPRVAYGRVYKWLSNDTRDKAYDPVRELVREHIIGNIPLGPDELVFGQPVGARHLYTLWDASKAVKLSHPALRRTLIALGYLDKSSSKKSNWETIFPAHVIDSIAKELNDRVSFNTARSYLRLPRHAMQTLFEAGVIKPFLPVSRGVAEHILRKRDLDDFLKQMIGDAPTVIKRLPGTYDIVTAAKRSLVPVADIGKAILEGQIKCTARLANAQGMLQILVHVDELKAFRNQKQKETGRITIEDARNVLGVTYTVMKRLIDEGYLEIERHIAPLRNKQQMYLKADSFAAFQREFVAASVIARELGTHVRTLVPNLKRQGINYAIGNQHVGQYFYQKASIGQIAALNGG